MALFKAKLRQIKPRRMKGAWRKVTATVYEGEQGEGSIVLTPQGRIFTDDVSPGLVAPGAGTETVKVTSGILSGRNQ